MVLQVRMLTSYMVAIVITTLGLTMCALLPCIIVTP